jgi:uncharacterized membrane protein YdbT with pleckstrin-like domain
VAYPDGLLQEGERVVLHRHPHWWVLIGPVLAFLVVLGAVGYLAALARGQGWAGWGWPVLGGAAAVLVGWLTVLPVVRWRTTHLVVTTRRVLVGEGVLKRQGLDVPLDRVVAVRVWRTRIGRLLGWGTLVLDTGRGGELEFVDVPDVDGVLVLVHREVV